MEVVIEQEAIGQEMEKVVTTIGLPPCPSILTALVRELRSDEPDNNRIARLIADDLTLAASVLRTVNSPLYGLRTKIGSTRQALSLLGQRVVTQLVTGLLLRQAFPGEAGAGAEEFWERTTGNARGCAFMARRTSSADAESAHTFALFRDCGIPALMSTVKGYRPVLVATAPGRPVTAIEKERYRTNHAMIGGRLAKIWHLPDAICDAVLWHHDYDALRNGAAPISEESGRLIALALAGEELYSRHTLETSCPEWTAHGSFALEQLGIRTQEFDELVDDAAAAIDAK